MASTPEDENQSLDVLLSNLNQMMGAFTSLSSDTRTKALNSFRQVLSTIEEATVSQQHCVPGDLSTLPTVNLPSGELMQTYSSAIQAQSVPCTCSPVVIQTSSGSVFTSHQPIPYHTVSSSFQPLATSAQTQQLGTIVVAQNEVISPMPVYHTVPASSSGIYTLQQGMNTLSTPFVSNLPSSTAKLPVALSDLTDPISSAQLTGKNLPSTIQYLPSTVANQTYVVTSTPSNQTFQTSQDPATSTLGISSQVAKDTLPSPNVIQQPSIPISPLSSSKMGIRTPTTKTKDAALVDNLMEENQLLKKQIELLTQKLSENSQKIADPTVQLTKRGTGHPVKSEKTDANTVEVPQTLKRKRGRPPKNPPKTGLKNVSDAPMEMPSQPKRKRGRPKGSKNKIKLLSKEEQEALEMLEGKTPSSPELSNPLPFTELEEEDRLRPKQEVEELALEDNDHCDLGGRLSDDDSSFEPLMSDLVEEPTVGTGKASKERRKDRLVRMGRPRPKYRDHVMGVVRKYKKSKNTHLCLICSNQFKHGNTFARHLKEHGGEGNVSCCTCRKVFYNWALCMHHKCKPAPKKRGRKGTPRQCRYCDSIFTNSKKLQKHTKLSHSQISVAPEFICRYCGRKYTSRKHLFEHFTEHAGDKIVCHRCGEFSADKESHDEHLKEHGLLANYVCEKCGATFRRKQQYALHLENHKKYDCLICNQNFATSKDLRLHQKNVHNILCNRIPQHKYFCTECGKTYARPGQLKIHLRLHTGEKPLQCEVCNISFRTNKALYKHKETTSHLLKTGELEKERDHLCSICGKAYFRKQALLRHIRYHTGEKPFNCPHCNYVCREKTNLQRHIALHFSQRDYVCETCGAAFHTKKTLGTHILYKHSDKKDFKCDKCGAGFKTSNALRRHEKTHLKEKPLKCEVCQTGFNRLYNLRRHLKSVHGVAGSLPKPNRVKLLDAPEGMEFNKSARLPYPPGTGQTVKLNNKSGRPRKKVSAIIEVSMPQKNKDGGSESVQALLQVGSDETVNVIHRAGYSILPTTPSAAHNKHSGTEVPLTMELLQQITGGDPDVMRAYLQQNASTVPTSRIDEIINSITMTSQACSIPDNALQVKTEETVTNTGGLDLRGAFCTNASISSDPTIAFFVQYMAQNANTS